MVFFRTTSFSGYISSVLVLKIGNTIILPLCVISDSIKDEKDKKDLSLIDICITKLYSDNY